jgi:hypothetical protein
MKEKIITNAQYLVFVLLILGQVTIGKSYVLGQTVYLVANIISITRCFLLRRPKADKVKDMGCTVVTIGCLASTFI